VEIRQVERGIGIPDSRMQVSQTEACYHEHFSPYLPRKGKDDTRAPVGTLQ